MVALFLNRLLGTSPEMAVARALAATLGSKPAEQGGVLRIHGTWKGTRCQVLLDGAKDQMTVLANGGPHNTQWEIAWAPGDAPELTFVSTQAALSAADAQRMERLPMKVRLHVIEVVESGRGSIRLAKGVYTLQVTRAGLDRPNAAAQAAIRLDVLADLVAAASKVF